MGQEELKVPEQSPMYWALRKERYTRQEYISKIQEITGRRLLVYFSTNEGSISFQDIQGFSDLLERLEGRDNDIDLLLQTTGGDIDVAEKIVYMCWEKAKSFRVIVAERAKSAGTLIALAADEIVMGYASELGPIDPQIFVPQTGETLPAHSYLDGLEHIADTIDIKDRKQVLIYMPLLEKLSPQLLDYCRKAIRRSEEFATKWLSRHMLQGNKRKARSIAKKLCDPKKYHLHGTVIDYKEARELGLKVTYWPPEDKCWKAIWQLFCMYTIDAEKEGFVKIFESDTISLPLHLKESYPPSSHSSV
ncbi:MAG TPA: hypothetical protein ENF86_01530 [Firmicutes bacterium]|nr:hypothetical protein [Bacillota bacterium]